MATSPFYLKGKGNGDGMTTSPFYLKGKGNGDGMATSPFYLKEIGWYILLHPLYLLYLLNLFYIDISSTVYTIY